MEERGARRQDVGDFPATGIIFRETPGTYDYSWHPAPRRQYIINLDGAVEITASDGEKRVIGPGEVFLVEDTHGKGHFPRPSKARCAIPSSSRSSRPGVRLHGHPDRR